LLSKEQVKFPKKYSSGQKGGFDFGFDSFSTFTA
jgi:hypothetical protein